jgi:hypothetical protein
VRALFVALRALDAPAAAPAAGKQRAAAAESAPSNSGKPWSDDEDKALAAAFDAGKQILELADRASAFALRDRSAARQARQDRAARQYARTQGRVGYGGLFGTTLRDLRVGETGGWGAHNMMKRAMRCHDFGSGLEERLAA